MADPITLHQHHNNNVQATGPFYCQVPGKGNAAPHFPGSKPFRASETRQPCITLSLKNGIHLQIFTVMVSHNGFLMFFEISWVTYMAMAAMIMASKVGYQRDRKNHAKLKFIIFSHNFCHIWQVYFEAPRNEIFSTTMWVGNFQQTTNVGWNLITRFSQPAHICGQASDKYQRKNGGSFGHTLPPII